MERRDGCWNCLRYDGNRCRKEWNNCDPDYYVDWRDDKEPDDCCGDHVLDCFAVYEDFFDGKGEET